MTTVTIPDIRAELEEQNIGLPKVFRLNVDRVVRARQLLADGDMDLAVKVMEEDLLATDGQARAAFRPFMIAGEGRRAVRVFDAKALHHNPVSDLAEAGFKTGMVLFLGLGILGGIVYLFDRLFGS